MKTLSLELSDQLDAKLERLAQRQGRTKSEVVQWVLASLDEPDTKSRSTFYEATRHLCGCVDDGPGDQAHHPQHMEGYGR